MKNLIKRNYQSILKRGLINKDTTMQQFLDKLCEETDELNNYKNFENFKEELCDIVLVCFNIAEHNGINIKKELKKKIKINEKRGQ